MDEKIYILCPSDYPTGGVECLHQLSHKLIEKGFNAFIYYIPKISGSKIEKYSSYNVNKIEKLEDDEKNIIIFPEVYLDKLKEFPKSKKFIWWLSVNNAKKNTTLPIGKWNKKFSFFKEKFPKVYDFLKKLYMGFNEKGKISFDFKNNEITHLAQSHYAKKFLESKGASKIFMMNDYLGKEFLHPKKINKENIVIYNPKKGKDITLKIISSSPKIKFVPLENMSAKEVATNLAKAKVYIDFGTHPGRDKFPREAVVNDCCIIVGKRGSASFLHDVPLKEEYRFDLKGLNVNKIIKKIQECFHKYEEKIKDFKIYKGTVLNDEEIMEKNIDKLFRSEI